jgi:undecaprenyl-phosphate 4-deoxy-4-formamido-L-arabinose transferase
MDLKRNFNPFISIIIPVYNSENILPDLYKRIVVVCKDLGLLYEIIFVEDNGNDDSWSVIQGIASFDKRVRGFSLSRNYGQHSALLCGINESKGDILITLDDDLQHLPENIPLLLDKLNENYDVVYGVSEDEMRGVFRNLSSKLFKWILQNAIGTKNARVISSFRIFRSHLKDVFKNYKNPNVNIDVLLTWVTSNYSFVKVKNEYRIIGSSGYSFSKLLRHALNLTTGFSTIPLQIASFIGFFFSIFGLGVLIYVLMEWFFKGAEIKGFTFLAAIISIFSGVQLLAVGIIGEYLSRMYFKIIDKPSYNIKSRT